MSKGRGPSFNHEEIYRLDEEGYTATEIAEMIGAKSNYHIRELIRNHRRETDPTYHVCRGRSHKPENIPIDAGKVRALYKAGWPILKIYDEFYGKFPIERICEVLK